MSNSACLDGDEVLYKTIFDGCRWSSQSHSGDYLPRRNQLFPRSAKAGHYVLAIRWKSALADQYCRIVEAIKQWDEQAASSRRDAGPSMSSGCPPPFLQRTLGIILSGSMDITDTITSGLVHIPGAVDSACRHCDTCIFIKAYRFVYWSKDAMPFGNTFIRKETHIWSHINGTRQEASK